MWQSLWITALPLPCYVNIKPIPFCLWNLLLFLLFFIKWKLNSCLWLLWSFRCFPVLTIVNSASVNIRVHASFQIMVFSRYMLRSGIAGSYTSTPFSVVAVPIYICNNSVGRFPFLCKGSQHFWSCQLFVQLFGVGWRNTTSVYRNG